MQRSKNFHNLSEEKLQPLKTGRVSGKKEINKQHSNLCVPALSRKVENLGLSEKGIQFYLDSWRPKTVRQYQVYIKKWYTLCVEKDWDKWNPTVKVFSI